jgi:hypothetical protein
LEFDVIVTGCALMAMDNIMHEICGITQHFELRMQGSRSVSRRENMKNFPASGHFQCCTDQERTVRASV